MIAKRRRQGGLAAVFGDGPGIDMGAFGGADVEVASVKEPVPEEDAGNEPAWVCAVVVVKQEILFVSDAPGDFLEEGFL
ncbi:MAG TPA: hypothetical protein VD713_01540 [Sphingomonadales bacterium]|nr:hypothetical protein [Sphingomonadales bacterium]